MKGFGPRFIVEFSVFTICQIIFIVFAVIFLKKYIGKHQVGILLSCIGCVIAFVVIIPFVSKYYLDLPYIIKNEYITAEVTALEFNTVKSEVPYDKTIKVRDNTTGEEFKVAFYTERMIEVGDVYEIFYLPHTKMAAIIKVINSAPPT